MFSALVVVSSVLSVAAFVPSRQFSSPSSLRMSSEIQSPGDFFWGNGVFDPLGFWNVDDETREYYKASEIKNGRVAMLAVVGYIVPEVFRLPGEIAPGLKFADVPNGVAAIQAIPALGWIQILFLIGFIDYRSYTGLSTFPFTSTAGVKKFPDAASKAKAEAQELNNGRLAMFAILELLRHDTQNYVQGTSVDGLSTHLITGLPFLYGN